MKKAFKIILKVLAGVAGILIVGNYVISFTYKDSLAFLDAVNVGDTKTIKYKLKEGYDPNKEEIWARPVSNLILIRCSFNQPYPFNTSFAKFLLDNGVSPNSDDTNYLSPLHYAILAKNSDYVKLLLDYGADINRDIVRYTPLDTAYIMRQEDIIAILEKNGAKLGEVGKTPIMATRVMEYYMRGITDERPVLQLINKNFHGREQLLEFFKTAQKQTNDFYKTENKDYDRKKILTIIKDYDK